MVTLESLRLAAAGPGNVGRPLHENEQSPAFAVKNTAGIPLRGAKAFD